MALWMWRRWSGAVRANLAVLAGFGVVDTTRGDVLFAPAGMDGEAAAWYHARAASGRRLARAGLVLAVAALVVLDPQPGGVDARRVPGHRPRSDGRGHPRRRAHRRGGGARPGARGRRGAPRDRGDRGGRPGRRRGERPVDPMGPPADRRARHARPGRFHRLDGASGRWADVPDRRCDLPRHHRAARPGGGGPARGDARDHIRGLAGHGPEARHAPVHRRRPGRERPARRELLHRRPARPGPPPVRRPGVRSARDGSFRAARVPEEPRPVLRQDRRGLLLVLGGLRARVRRRGRRRPGMARRPTARSTSPATSRRSARRSASTAWRSTG